MTHTPGPWTYDEDWSLIMGANGAEVAALHAGSPDDGSQRESRNTVYANAALIAAAPDLLEHATWVVRLYGTDNPKGLAELREHIHALSLAIDKAVRK